MKKIIIIGLLLGIIIVFSVISFQNKDNYNLEIENYLQEKVGLYYEVTEEGINKNITYIKEDGVFKEVKIE